MFDQNLYTHVMNAVNRILQESQSQLGLEFCNRFMTDHDLNNTQHNPEMVQKLMAFTSNGIRQLQTGYNTGVNADMLFRIATDYIGGIFNMWRQRQGGGRQMFNQGPVSQYNNLGNQGIGQFGGRSAFGQSSANPYADTPSPTQAAYQPPVQTPVDMAPPINRQPFRQEIDMPTFHHNILEEFPEGQSEFKPVDAPNVWGGEAPKRDYIIGRESVDFKAGDGRFSIRMIKAHHKVIHTDPVDVLRDFFRTAPDALLNKNFCIDITYSHLEVIDVATPSFRTIQAIIRGELQKSTHTQNIWAITKEVMSELLKHGPYVNFSKYLLRNILRAFALNARLEEDPELYLRFSDLEDLDVIFSPNYQHRLKDTPDGREKLKHIAEVAIVNSLVNASGALFSDDDLTAPIRSIRRSQAFPSSIPGVYNDKDHLVAKDENEADYLRTWKAWEDNVGRKQTYVISRRSVVITNILGQRILPVVGDKPMHFPGTVPALMNIFKSDYLSFELKSDRGYFPGLELLIKEYEISHNLENVPVIDPTEKPQEVVYDLEQPDYITKGFAHDIVDRNIFAFALMNDPTKYLKSFDLLDTLNGPSKRAGAILMRNPLPSISPS